MNDNQHKGWIAVIIVLLVILFSKDNATLQIKSFTDDQQQQQVTFDYSFDKELESKDDNLTFDRYESILIEDSNFIEDTVIVINTFN